jgi:hypothetical protein
VELEARRAESAAELDRLAEYRYRIYVDELGLLAAAAAGEGGRLVDELDEVSTSYAVFDGERVVGSLRMTHLPAVRHPAPLFEKFELAGAVSEFGADALCTTSRFIVDEAARRSRAMLRMMELCYEDAGGLGVRLNYGDTSPGLLLFYEHMGYRRYTRPWLDGAYGLKLPIVMVGRDHDRFRRVRSPLHRVSARYPDDPEARAWFESTYLDSVECESAPFQPPGAFAALVERRAGRPLAELPLLGGLTAREVETVLAKASLFEVRAGDPLLRPGERTRGLLIVVAGELSEGLVVAGDVSGRFAHNSAAAVVAVTVCSLLILPESHLEHLGGDDRLRAWLGALPAAPGGR